MMPGSVLRVVLIVPSSGSRAFAFIGTGRLAPGEVSRVSMFHALRQRQAMIGQSDSKLVLSCEQATAGEVRQWSVHLVRGMR